uniref:RNase H type-1 domain-containing protein n=1 Tax=Quercus lobata TaxID=97700 RepID=A0A7N2KK54_QUELO
MTQTTTLPLRGWYKLNTDGSSLGNSGAAGGGGVIRDASSAWIRAFSINIGSTTSFLAELWALRDGLIMCKELQLHAVEVELDARVVSDLMNHNGGSNEVNSSLVADCRLLIAQMP